MTALARIFVCLALASALVPAYAQKGKRKVSFRPLFNGKDFTGWHNYGRQGVKPQWKVEDGAICLTGSGGGDIVTDGKYENYVLELDWKMSEGGNSGLFYLVNEDTAQYKHIWQTAPEYQLLDNDKHKDGAYENHRAGANYDLITPLPGHTKPIGEWNHTKLVVNGGKVEHWLNDALVVSYSLWTPEWDAMVAKSKFKTFAGYGKAKIGSIGLQDHGDKVWFKNIKIMTL